MLASKHEASKSTFTAIDVEVMCLEQQEDDQPEQVSAEEAPSEVM